MTEIEKLERGIAALEAQRIVLGDDVVNSMLAPIHEKLAALKAQQTHVEQRKQVTVLFADISGFTALAATLDAEDVLEQINALWERLDTIITTYGGLVDKHIGDEVMALWGTEAAREDDPERAIRAALDMQASLFEFHRTQPLQLTLRIGIHTGLAMLGTIGSKHEYTAMGDTVNLASRLQHAAPVGGILISHNAYRQARGVFDMLVQDPLTIKGRTEPVQTYIVLQVKPRAFRLRTRGVEGIETRMVGRTNELQQLQSAQHIVMEKRKLQFITVVGEAGVGKSRLLYEFQNWLDLFPQKILLFKGRATEAMRNLPYALLRDVFAYRFEIADSDPLALAQEKLERGIAGFMPDDAEAAMKAHFIGHLIGLNFSTSEFLRGILDDPKQIRNRAFHYLAQFFQAAGRASKSAVTVIFLDDLHWADDGSLDALVYLVNAVRDLPVLIVSLTRPVLFEQRPDWVCNKRLDIKPLSEQESDELVNEILQKASQIPQDLRELLVEGAEGNPFYLEELVKMLIDQKVILPGELTWTVESTRLATTRVPSTLTGVLQSRLDHLPSDELETMQRASVIGRVFWDHAIGALNEAEPVIPFVELRSLRNRELVFEREASAFAGTHEYIFKHAILREVTYETVLKRLRRLYHARTAIWLIEMSSERSNEYAGFIAEHFELAGASLQAAQWYGRAGEDALARSAFTTAMNYFTRAIELTPRDASTFSMLARQKGDACFRLGDLPAALQALQDAQATAQSIDDRADALASLAEVSSETGEYENAHILLAKALPQARKSANQITLTRSLFALGSVQWRLGKMNEAQAAFDECLTLARALGDVTRELFALNRLGAVALSKGLLDEAEQLWKEVYTRAIAVGNRERAMAALNNLGAVASSHNEYVAAREYIQGALDMARELGTQQTAALAIINLAEIDINLGNLTDARAGLREGLAFAMQLGLLPRVLGAVVFFAELAYAEGDIERSLSLWGLARHHPAWTSELQRAMDMALANWKLAPEFVETGLAKGAKLDWEATLQELLRE